MTTSTPDVYLGVQIEINNQVVDLIPQTPINQIKEKGFKLKLASPVNLGTLKQALPSILNGLGIDKNKRVIMDEKGEIKPTNVTLIDNIVNKVVNADLTINAFAIDQPPTNENNSSNTDTTINFKGCKYVFIASATWQDQKDQKTDKQNTKNVTQTEPPDFFKLKGIIVGVTQGYEDKDAADNFLKIASQMNTTKQIAPADDKGTAKIEPAKSDKTSST